MATTTIKSSTVATGHLCATTGTKMGKKTNTKKDSSRVAFTTNECTSGLFNT